MKKYIKILAVVTFICGLYFYSYSDLLVMNSKNYIMPAGTGSEAIVDVIKKHSDITAADVEKYKLLWLGWFGAVPALTAVGTSAYGGYKAAKMVFDSEKTGMAFDFIKSKAGLLPSLPGKETLNYYGAMVPGTMQSWGGMTSDFLKTQTPWIAAVSAGAGLISYKIFYPRIRQGVLSKVQKFLDMCKNLTVANNDVNVQADIFEWRMAEDIAVCRAINNLEEQARYASTLLVQVGLTDPIVTKMYQQLKGYYSILLNNKNNLSGLCNSLIVQTKQNTISDLQQKSMESQIFGQKIQNVKNVLSIMQKVGSGVFNFARDVANFGIANKEPLGALGASYWLYKKIYPTKP